MKKLDLNLLRSTIIPALTPTWRHTRLEAAFVMLDYNNHSSGVRYEITQDSGVSNGEMYWSDQITDQIKRTYSDIQVATELAAEGIAALSVNLLTQYDLVQRSWKGTGVDYFLCEKVVQDSALLFNKAARLEVSGLKTGTDSQYKSRVNVKKDQTHQSDNTGLPAFVSVTDFGKPRTTFVRV